MEIELSTQINASAEEIYDTWLSSDGHTKMTGGGAIITNSEGDDFSAWDEYITGRNIQLEPPHRIIQLWRTSDFSDYDTNSHLEIELKENNGTTNVILTHTNLPEHGEQYIEGWEEHYFVPMKAYFSK